MSSNVFNVQSRGKQLFHEGIFSNSGSTPLASRLWLAEEHDAEEISATLRAAFAEFKTLYTPLAFSATTPSADQIAERFAEGPIWIAELADTIVGTVATVPKGSELYIRSMAVRPSARGSGIGARLLNTVEAFAAAHRYRRLLLNTAPFLLAAVQLYERHGFQYTGEQPDLFGTQLHTMAKDVSIGILEAE